MIDVTARTPEIATYARWSKGKHPTAEGIRAYIEEGSMYLYRENGMIVGAMAVTMYQVEDYHAIEWIRQVLDDERITGTELDIVVNQYSGIFTNPFLAWGRPNASNLPFLTDCFAHFTTDMRGTPNTADMRANVDSVKLWVPPSHE